MKHSAGRSCAWFVLWLLSAACGACGHAASFRMDPLAADDSQRAVDCAEKRQSALEPGPIVDGGRRVALVIGNNAYAQGALANARNDAQEIGDSLRGLGFQVDLQLDASRAAMLRAIDAFRERRKAAGGLGLFFFAGHGVQINDKNYLIPIDAAIRDARSVELEAVSADEVLIAMGAGGGAGIAILDACRDNPFPSIDRSVPRGLAVINAPSSTLIAYATAPGMTAADGPPVNSPDGQGRTRGHGVFTGALLRHIADEGLTVEQMLKRTATEVRRATNDMQRPWMSFDWTEDVFLNPVRPADPDELIELADANMESGDYTSVIRDMERLLGSDSHSLTDAQRAGAEQRASEARRRLALLDLRILPQEATLRLDGTLHRSNAGRLCVNPGGHELRISENGYQTMLRTVQLGDGSSQVLHAQLADEIPRGPRVTAGWVAGATGAAALVTALGTRLRARGIDKQLDAVCDEHTCPPEAEAELDLAKLQRKGHRNDVASAVLLGTGLAGVAAGAVLVFGSRWFGFMRDQRQTARLNCDRAGCAAQLAMAF